MSNARIAELEARVADLEAGVEMLSVLVGRLVAMPRSERVEWLSPLVASRREAPELTVSGKRLLDAFLVGHITALPPEVDALRSPL